MLHKERNNSTEKRKIKITVSFQEHLLLIVFFFFLLACILLWILLTGASVKRAQKSLQRGIDDIHLDIDESILSVAQKTVADEFPDGSTSLPDNEKLAEYASLCGIDEINYIDENGIILRSNLSEYIGFDMRNAGEQSKKFDADMQQLIQAGISEYIPESSAISFDASVHRKYAGISLDKGYVQIGFDADEDFQNKLDDLVQSVSRNRHIGAAGGFIIANPDRTVISVPDSIDDISFTEEEKELISVFLAEKLDMSKKGKMITEEMAGQNYLFMFDIYEGYYIITFIPEREVHSPRTITTTIMAVILLTTMITLFYFIYRLIKRSIVDNIRSVNRSLQEINGGKLDTKIEVRDNLEFDMLSTNINQTVATLNRYIDDAKKRIDTELSYAKLIQKSSLPSVYPPFPGRDEIDICGGMTTANEVGGDFYDYFFISETTLCFLIADVSGKGIPAAMFMMRARSALKSCAQRGMTPVEVFSIVNDALCENNEANMFVTVWMGWLDTKTGEIRYINAGHNPPLIRHSRTGYDYLSERSGAILAAIEGKRFKEHTVTLSPGDSLLLYTDGITEACDTQNAEYGEERLKEHLNALPEELNAEELCSAVKQGAAEFAGEAPQFDDMTVLALTFKGGAAL